MKNIHLYLKIFFVIAAFFFVIEAKCEPKPRWVKKGVSELNKKRTNDTYYFQILHEEFTNENSYQYNPLKSLVDYIDSRYDVKGAEITVDSIPANGTLPTTYLLNYTKDGEPQTVYARQIDSYSNYEGYADNSFDYNYYQLYAISEPGLAEPEFDKFVLKRKYGVAPLFMSIIPGLGQIYKGQQTKGFTILGVEAAFIITSIYSATQVHKWKGWQDRTGISYKSKITTFRELRDFSLIAGGLLYVYNLFDAALAKGARYVKVERPNAPNMEMTFTPVIWPDYCGIGVNINF